MTNMIKAEFYKVFKGKALYILTLFSSLILILNIFTAKENGLLLKVSVNNFLTSKSEFSFFSISLSIIMFFLVVFYVEEDFKSGIIKEIFSRGIDRTKFMLSKVIVISIILSIVITLFYIILFIVKSSFFVGNLNDLYIVFFQFLLNIFQIFSGTMQMVVFFMIGKKLSKSLFLMILFSFVYVAIFAMSYLLFPHFTKECLLATTTTFSFSKYITTTILGVLSAILFFFIGKSYLKRMDVK